MKKKLELTDLKVQSFITTSDAGSIKGGAQFGQVQIATYVHAVCGDASVSDCPSIDVCETLDPATCV